MTHNDGAECWRAPTLNKTKVNVDAALFSSSFSYSVVARNHHGKLVEAISKCMQGSIEPEKAEALSVKEALSWIKRRTGRMLKWNSIVCWSFKQCVARLQCYPISEEW